MSAVEFRGDGIFILCEYLGPIASPTKKRCGQYFADQNPQIVI
jgi:hypothetical protein